MFTFTFKDNTINELDRFVDEVMDKIEARSGTRRKQMFKKGHGHTEPKGAFSITYGYTNLEYISPTKSRKAVEGMTRTYETTFLTAHPELKAIFQQLVDLHCPEPFTVDQVQINKNWWSPPHKDSGNVGHSWICGLGDYTGGETVVEFDDSNHFEYDIKNRFVGFNGSLFTHWTKPFDGKRYSLVFYNHKISS